MLSELLAFVIASFIVELTPGPNMAYLAVLSLSRGRIAGLAAVAGVALGLLVLGLAAGYGAGTLLSQNRLLYEALRWGGVAFLLWLAWDAYREAREPLAEVPDGQQLRSFFVRGLVTNLLNPKAALFYITVMPNFVVVGGEIDGGSQKLTLTMAYVVAATVVHAGIVVLAGSLQPLLVSSRWRRRLGIVFAILLVGIAVWLAVTTRRIW